MAEFVVAKIDEVPPGTGKVIFAGDKALALFNINGNFYAIDNTCPHRGGPLGEGDLNDKMVTCPLHGWEFEIDTGNSPTGAAVSTYKVTVDQNTKDVKVEV